MAVPFDEEDFALTFTLISTVLILFFLGFQILSTPHQSYLAIYAVSDKGNVIVSNVTRLHLGDELKLQIVLENHMGRAIKAELQTVITGDLTFTSALTEGGQNSTVDEQVFTIDDEERSVATITFAVIKARFDKSSLTVQQVEVNGYKRNVMVESPSRNQTFRLIFNLLIWSYEDEKYVTKWSDGLNDHTSWLQIWFELVPEVEG